MNSDFGRTNLTTRIMCLWGTCCHSHATSYLVLSLICIVSYWKDRQYMPPYLFNSLSPFVYTALGLPSPLHIYINVKVFLRCFYLIICNRNANFNKLMNFKVWILFRCIESKHATQSYITHHLESRCMFTWPLLSPFLNFHITLLHTHAHTTVSL